MEQIKEFLQKMVDQNNRGTMVPYYYVIRSEVEDSAPLDNADTTKWYWQDGTYNSWEEIEKYCRDNEYTDEQLENVRCDAHEYGIKKRWERRGMFLTESDAESHLKLNHYHYSDNAHTYVEHAWRAPELEKFIGNLLNYFEVKKEGT